MTFTRIQTYQIMTKQIYKTNVTRQKAKIWWKNKGQTQSKQQTRQIMLNVAPLKRNKTLTIYNLMNISEDH